MSTLFGLLILILDLVVIAKVLTGEGPAQHKLLWTLIVLFLPVIGLILYYFLGRNPQDAQFSEG